MADRTKNLTHMGKGRQKGVPNRTTAALKEIISAFVEHNAADAQVLFDRVKEKSPARALALLVKFMEFVLPRQHQSEVTASVTSISFDANRPIVDAASAAAAYAELIGNPHADMSQIVFATPAPAPLAVAPPRVTLDAPAPEPIPRVIPEPFPAKEPGLDPASELWRRLGE